VDNQSRYCYPGTDILINKENIRETTELQRFETIVASYRLAELEHFPIFGRFDLKHLQGIHRHLFQDVYPFAGSLRTENIAKGYFQFARHDFILSSAKQLFFELQFEGHLKNNSADRFADRAAYYMAEINVLHPFREGNGRTQREFIRTLGMNAGYRLDWGRVLPQDVLNASIKSVVDSKDLRDVIRSCIVNTDPEQHLSQAFRKRRSIERER
jgi:cell filamentation protein